VSRYTSKKKKKNNNNILIVKKGETMGFFKSNIILLGLLAFIIFVFYLPDPRLFIFDKRFSLIKIIDV
jgi:hypothetical protein